MTPLEAAQANLDRARQELRETEKQIAVAETEIRRFGEKESVNTQDVVTHENARRRLPRLQRDREESQRVVAAASAALAVATRERDLADLAETRGRVAPLREKLVAIATRIADAPSVEPAAWAAVHDPAFVKDLRTTIAALQGHVSRWQPGSTLTPDDDAIDSGPWASFEGGDGYPLFAALCDSARDVLAAREAARRAREEEADRLRREAEEAERRAQAEREEADRQSLEPQLIRDARGKVRWHYTPEAARRTPVPAEHIQIARTDPSRAIATFDARTLALISAKDRQAREALQGAAERNAAEYPRSTLPPSFERDLLDQGSRIDVHHRPELLEEL